MTVGQNVTLGGMADLVDHYLETVELLDQVSQLETELASAYRRQNRGEPGNHSARLGELHQRLNRALRLAQIHSTLALAQVHQPRPLSA